MLYKWERVSKRLGIDRRWSEAVNYLDKSEECDGITLQRLWQILDQAWEELSSKNSRNLNLSNFLREYYQHPVWLINAAFSESDQATINDRLAAVRLITHVQPRKILDFGGGIGTVSRLCATYIPQVEVIDLVDITEFRQTIQHYLSDFPQIRILEQPDPLYDAIISTEVLEHLIDPIGAIVEINRLLRVGGTFAASWSFAPCIKCHLQQNFNLQKLMLWIIRSLGFGFYGFERRGSTLYGFVKHSEITSAMLKKAHLLEFLARLPIPFDRFLFLLRGL